MALPWFIGGVLGFAVALFFRVTWLRPSDETLMEALLDRSVLLTAVGAGIGMAIAAAIL